MNARQLLLVDFDRTLFDLTPFWRALWQSIGKHYKHVDGEHEFATIESWYKPLHNLRTYYFDEHIKAVVGKDATVEEIVELVHKELKGTNFLFDDANLIFDWHKKYTVRILTFGEERVQKLKFSLCPSLDAIPRDIILEPKGQFIANNFKGYSGWLVDDKHNDTMPDGFKEIHLVRESVVPFEIKDGILTINSLRSVEEAMK